MTDEQLRRLERRWKETGLAGDEAAHLLQRVRAGEDLDWTSYARLTQLNVHAAACVLSKRLERGSVHGALLDLAALLGHEPARTVRDAPPPWDLLDLARAWLDALDGWDHAALRAGLITQPDEGRLRATIALLDATTRARDLTPCQLAQLQAALRVAEADLVSPAHEFLDGAFLYPIAEAGAEDVYSPARSLTKCFVDSHMSSGWPQAVAAEVVDRLELVTPAEAADVVRQELVPWALGLFDPIRERVLLRQHLGSRDADNTPESRAWIQAESTLAVDPAATVTCPACRQTSLDVTLQRQEHRVSCPACGRQAMTTRLG